MRDGILLEVDRIAKYSDEDVLGADVEIEGRADQQPDHADSVCDLLDGWACAPEGGRRDPLPAPSIYHETECEIGRGNETHCRGVSENRAARV